MLALAGALYGNTLANDLVEARQLYEAALAREPHDAAAHLNLGIVHQRQGRRAAAEAAYRNALVNDPRQSEAARGLAALLTARGEMAEAAQVLERATAAGDGRRR